MRKIIHIDMDAFFASVEQRDNPSLRDKPIAVGGRPEQRGVVATASYTARQFGIRSAMPMATAVRLCPELIIVRSNMSHYRQVAEQIREIFTRFTDKIEPLSIDEAYLDVSESHDFQGSATLIAQHILATIEQETQLTASAGISYCKFLAKYASNLNKPNGSYTITPNQALAIIATLPIEKFHGIGPATQKKLNQLNIYTGRDLRHADINQLRQQLGKSAEFYYQLAHGRDNRSIQTHRERKSLGNETTFDHDIDNKEHLLKKLEKLMDETWQQLIHKGLSAMTLTVKIKYADFTLQTKSHTQSSPIYHKQSAQLIAAALLSQAKLHKPVRLLGISCSQLVSRTHYPIQQRLFD